GTGRPADHGFLATKREYADFVLRCDFQLAKGAVSGVVPRARGLKKAAPPTLKINLADGAAACGAFLSTGGPQVIGAPLRPAPLRGAGNWERLEVVADGRTLRASINGAEVLNVDLDKRSADAAAFPILKNASGVIALQNGDGEVRFRRIQIKE